MFLLIAIFIMFQSAICSDNFLVKISSDTLLIGDTLHISVEGDSVDIFKVYGDGVYLYSSASPPFRYSHCTFYNYPRSSFEVEVVRNGVTHREEYSINIGDEVVRPRARVVRRFPGDTSFFTQGFFYYGGFFYMNSGKRGYSRLRQVIPESGVVVRETQLPEQYFGEGITLFGDIIFQLTWQEEAVFSYNLSDFTPIERFSFSGEGWGLTNDGESLIRSDGSHLLYFHNPETFELIDSLAVTLEGRPLRYINELVYFRGRVLANIWYRDEIALIDLSSGRVLALIDCGDLRRRVDRVADVLNGVAWDDEGERLFVTGKYWSHIFEIIADF